MKKTTLSIVLLLVVFLVVYGYQTSIAQQATDAGGASAVLKIGVVNVSKVLTESQENLEREKLMQEKQQQIKAKLQELEGEANEIRHELENVLQPGSQESSART